MPKLLLNAVSVTVRADAQIVAGVQPFDKDALDALREEHRGNYLFRRSGEDGALVYAVALKPDLPVLGVRSERFALLTRRGCYRLLPLRLSYNVSSISTGRC